MKKVAIVTGAAKGIGAATATKLARNGYAVCINYKTSKEKAEELKTALEAEGLEVMTFKADCSKRNEVSNMMEAVHTKFGPVNYLVNNAGICIGEQFQDITEERWDETFDANIKSVFITTQEVLKDMLPRKFGSIVNISSMWGFRAASCEVSYSATKAAVIELTKSLAAELGPSNIRINAVAPGVTMTDMVGNLTEEALESLAADAPLGRNGNPEDVANAVAFLLSDEASYITGETLSVDGGITV